MRARIAEQPPKLENSLLISLITGILGWRPVRERLLPPPQKLLKSHMNYVGEPPAGRLLEPRGTDPAGQAVQGDVDVRKAGWSAWTQPWSASGPALGQHKTPTTIKLDRLSTAETICPEEHRLRAAFTKRRGPRNPALEKHRQRGRKGVKPDQPVREASTTTLLPTGIRW
jgi:hypothetical protein